MEILIYLFKNRNVLGCYHLFKGNTKFIQKVTFEPLMDFRQDYYLWKLEIRQKLQLLKVFFI